MLTQPLAAISEPEPYRITVEEWHRLGEAGFFTDDHRVELLDGEIILMSPIGDHYSQVTTHAPGDTISPLAFPDVSVQVAEIIPVR